MCQNDSTVVDRMLMIIFKDDAILLMYNLGFREGPALLGSKSSCEIFSNGHSLSRAISFKKHFLLLASCSNFSGCVWKLFVCFDSEEETRLNIGLVECFLEKVSLGESPEQPRRGHEDSLQQSGGKTHNLSQVPDDLGEGATSWQEELGLPRHHPGWYSPQVRPHHCLRRPRRR